MTRILLTLALLSNIVYSVVAAPTQSIWNTTEAAIVERYGCRTNAECLRYGKPVKKPSRRKSALQARASITASSSCYVGVSKTNDGSASLGYISKTVNSVGLYVYTTDISNALQVTVPTSFGTIGNLAITTATRTGAFPYLAFQYGSHSSGSTITSSNGNYAYLTAAETALTQGAPQTGDVTLLQTDNDITTGVETAVWSMSSAGAITATWTNSGGGTYPLLFVWTAAIDYLGGTGNVADANALLTGDGFVEVYFTCIL